MKRKYMMKSSYISFIKVIVISVIMTFNALIYAQDTDDAVWDIQINLLDGTQLIFQVDNNLSVKVEDNTFILCKKCIAEPDNPSESAKQDFESGLSLDTDSDSVPDQEQDPSSEPTPDPEPDPSADSEIYTLRLSDVKSYTYVKRVVTGIDSAVRSCLVLSLEGNVLIINDSENSENQIKIFDANGILIGERSCVGSARLNLDTCGKGLRIISINGRQSLKCLIE